jgi:hypothetical protein
MSRGTPRDLFDNEEACHAKASLLRTMAEGDLSPESNARTLEIAAEWEATPASFRRLDYEVRDWSKKLEVTH